MVHGGESVPLLKGVGQSFQFSRSPCASGAIEFGFIEIDDPGSSLFFVFAHKDVSGVQIGMPASAPVEVSQSLSNGRGHGMRGMGPCLSN